MLLGKILKDYREFNRCSIRKLAKAIGVDYQVLFRFERGVDIGSESLVKIFEWVISDKADPSRQLLLKGVSAASSKNNNNEKGK